MKKENFQAPANWNMDVNNWSLCPELRYENLITNQKNFFFLCPFIKLLRNICFVDFKVILLFLNNVINTRKAISEEVQ